MSYNTLLTHQLGISSHETNWQCTAEKLGAQGLSPITVLFRGQAEEQTPMAFLFPYQQTLSQMEMAMEWLTVMCSSNFYSSFQFNLQEI